MKRMLCLALTLVLVMGALCMHPATLTLAAGQKYGDANKDTSVDARDALLVLQVAVSKATISDDMVEYADVDDTGSLDAKDALLILQFAVKIIDHFPAGPDISPDEYMKDDSAVLEKTMDQIIADLDQNVGASAVSDVYQLHNDGGLIYNPLSSQMTAGEKTKYNLAKKKSGTLKLDSGMTLTYSVPTDVTAYDMIPVEYTLSETKESAPVYVEATTFEDKTGSFYDLALPGTVALDFDYLGYVYADNETTNRPYLSKDFTSDRVGTQYPQYNASELIDSDTAPSNKPLWFKFKITNTGNTILDGDGGGTFCFDPYLADANGNSVKDVANMYYRLTEDLYPGDSVEMYIYFGEGSGMRLSPGDYKVVVNCLVRNEQSAPDWGTKIWGGYNYATATKDITITEQPTVTHNSETTYKQLRGPQRDTWLHTYEEFTTSYDAWTLPTVDIKAGEKHTLWVQPAAWSDRLVLKFMRGNDLNMKSVTIPLNVETDSISITLNQTASNYIVKDDGTKYPGMASQSMCDMRVNDSLSPYSNQSQLNELLDMKECGVNIVTTTEAFNIETSNEPSNKIANNTDAIFFVSDVLRKLGDMRMEGYTGYSYSSGTTMSAAFWYSRDARVSGKLPQAFGDESLDIANGLRGLYQFMRWGDNYWINGTGKPIINTEDTRGWMRIDFNARFLVGSDTVSAFQKWLRTKYKNNLNALNEHWSQGSYSYDYKAWTDIDPLEGTGDDHGWSAHNVASATFPEWQNAIADWDIFRTLERTENYATVIDVFKNYNDQVKDLGASSVDVLMGIRTEGGNMTGIVDPNTTSSRLRHAYYDQRRCALIPEILAKSGVVAEHSDYVTLPYSINEFTQLVSSSASIGITSMPLLQASRMRDIAINTRYGDNFRVHYNLSGEATKGAYINTQISVFEAYKAIYEAGGVPGVLWQDYLCDGYVTETQQKEMKFYSSKIAEMMETDEAKAWATTNVPDTKSVYEKSNGVYSYSEEYIQAEIDAALQRRAAEKN